MTTRWPSSCLGAVSSVSRHSSSYRSQLVLARVNARRYANHSNKPVVTPERPEKAALLAVEGHGRFDPINAPSSTLPPLLKLPTRGPESALLYYYRIGKAYGGFYFTGVKAVWFNYKASKAIRARINKDIEANKDKHYSSLDLHLLTRSEYQVLMRNSHDIGKLPLFSVLVALLGEWLPLFVPFMPGVVPGTCRIPKQVVGMREKAEQRRRTSFRRGITAPSKEQVVNAWSNITKCSHQEGSWPWPMCSRPYAATAIERLHADQLFHLSCTLNVHNRVWDWINVPPPTLLLRRALAKRLKYVSSDDILLLKYGGTARLSQDELNIACEERGIDVNGRREEVLRSELGEWLKRQQADSGRGFAILHMLFRRPNAWKSSEGVA